MLRDYRVSCWGEDINMGRSNFSNVSFSNIGQQMIDTMKYFQICLAQIASTVTSQEKRELKS